MMAVLPDLVGENSNRKVQKPCRFYFSFGNCKYMERGSPSRRSWADVCDEAEAADAAGETTPPQLPPLAGAAHAAQVLRTSSLNPDAEPFSTSPGERLHFSDSDESLGDSDASSPPPPPGRGKDPVLPRRHLRSSRPRAQPSGFMAAARREQPPRPVRAARREVPRLVRAAQVRLRSFVGHPARMNAEPDADGFRTVES